MGFTPISTIYLCNVPFDNSNKHQVIFSNTNEQYNYFIGKRKLSFVEYLTVRETLPDGSTQSSIKVNASIDQLKTACCNYLMYQNLNLSNKWYYAFITKLIYVNEGTTKVVFETDVFQTYFFNVTIKESYVKREHAVTDERGDNIVPESFNVTDYDEKLIKTTDLTECGYLIITNKPIETEFGYRWKISGIYQGLCFYYFEDDNMSNIFLSNLQEQDGNSIVSITIIPKFCLKGVDITPFGTTDITEGNGRIMSSDNPVSEEIVIDFTETPLSFYAYTPKNNKLFTSPFMKLIVTNHSGSRNEYKLEDFYSVNNVKFKMCGDISTAPSIFMYPMRYRHLQENYDEGITLSGFPQCSSYTDSYQLWQAKNRYSNEFSVINSLAQVIGGVGMVAFNPVNALGGASMIGTGANGIMNSISAHHQAKYTPNGSNIGNASNNLITAMKINKFDFYIQTIKREHAESIDNFFTMYGYATNKLKQPNLNSRPYFNYIETIDINVVGTIPQDDLLKFKSIFNSGVTLWKPTATMYDYSVDNSPTE